MIIKGKILKKKKLSDFLWLETSEEDLVYYLQFVFMLFLKKSDLTRVQSYKHQIPTVSMYFYRQDIYFITGIKNVISICGYY